MITLMRWGSPLFVDVCVVGLSNGRALSGSGGILSRDWWDGLRCMTSPLTFANRATIRLASDPSLSASGSHVREDNRPHCTGKCFCWNARSSLWLQILGKLTHTTLQKSFGCVSLMAVQCNDLCQVLPFLDHPCNDSFPCFDHTMQSKHYSQPLTDGCNVSYEIGVQEEYGEEQSEQAKENDSDRGAGDRRIP